MRLLLDEQIDKEVAAALRERGFDVIAVTEDPELVGSTDQDLLAHALRDRRVVVSHDVADFRRVASDLLTLEEHHYGLVLVSRRRFPKNKSDNGQLVAALAELLGRYPADAALSDREVWLA